MKISEYSKVILISTVLASLWLVLMYFWTIRIPSSSKEEVARAFVMNFGPSMLEKYRIKFGHYPSTVEGFGALLTDPAINSSKFHRPPVDPWHNLYQYRCPSYRSKNAYDIFSFGPDGYESKDDIGNWEAESWFFRFFRGKN